MSIVKRIIKNNIEFVKVDELLAEEYEQAGYGGIQLTKTPLGAQINLFAMRPGRVIGKRGRAIKAASERLETELGLPNPQITVIEVEVPELNPQIMAARIANALERGVHFRRAIFWSLRRIMDSGALGCEILLKGPLRSARSRFEKVVEGYVPKSGEPALRNVKISTLHVKMKRGTLGVTVKIVPPDAKFPDKVSLEGLPDIEYQLPMEEPAPVAEVPVEAAEPVITDEAVTEEAPVQEETPVEGAAVEPTVEEPVVEGSTPAEPAVDEPTVEGAPEVVEEEAVVEEPAIEEPEASAPEEVVAEESTVEETIEAAEPVVTDEVVEEEAPVKEETPVEEPAVEPEVEELAIDEAVKVPEAVEEPEAEPVITESAPEVIEPEEAPEEPAVEPELVSELQPEAEPEVETVETEPEVKPKPEADKAEESTEDQPEEEKQ